MCTFFQKTKQMMKRNLKKRENFVKRFHLFYRVDSSDEISMWFSCCCLCQFVSETKRKLKAKTSIQSEKINKEGGAGHARMREIKRDDDGTTMKLLGG